MDGAAAVDERFAANLRPAREHAGLSQEALAEAMRHLGFGSFTQQAIARIEAGRRRVSFAEAVALAQCVHTTADALSRPAEVAAEAFLILDTVRAVRAAAAAITEQTRVLAAGRDRLARAIGRAERAGTDAEMGYEIGAAQAALKETSDGGLA